MLSSAGTTYNRDYLAETPEGHQCPMLNVFHRDGDTIRHFWGSELLLRADRARTGHAPRRHAGAGVEPVRSHARGPAGRLGRAAALLKIATRAAPPGSSGMRATRCCRWGLVLALVAATPASAAQVVAPRDVAAGLAVGPDGRAFVVSPSARPDSNALSSIRRRAARPGAAFGPSRTLMRSAGGARPVDAGVAADGSGVIIVQAHRSVHAVAFGTGGALGDAGRAVRAGRPRRLRGFGGRAQRRGDRRVVPPSRRAALAPGGRDPRARARAGSARPSRSPRSCAAPAARACSSRSVSAATLSRRGARPRARPCGRRCAALGTASAGHSGWPRTPATPRERPSARTEQRR